MKIDPLETGFVPEAILATAHRDPGHTALITRHGPVSYGQLSGDMLAAAHALQARGLAPGTWLGIAAKDERTHLTLSLAAMVGGCEHVSLGSHETDQARQELLARLPRGLVLASDGGSVTSGPDLLDAATLLRETQQTRSIQRGGGALFTSSGSTGKPKLAHFDRATLVESFRRYRDTAGQVVAQTISVEHGVGKKRAWRTLLSGGTLVMAEACGPAEVLKSCALYRVEKLFLSAYALADLAAQMPGQSINTVTRGLHLVCTGSKIPLESARSVAHALSARVSVAYGTTETGTLCLTDLAGLERHPDSVGRPVEGIELRITDPDGQTVAMGAEGLVAVRGKGCLNRYLDGAEAHRFRDGWFTPGDIGRQEPDGTLTLLGREHDRMILNGMNIFPAEIERAALRHPQVRMCAAFAIRSVLHGDIPALAYVADPALEPPAMIAHCRNHLGPRAPRAAFARTSLPLNPQGKILRHLLAAEHSPPPS